VFADRNDQDSVVLSTGLRSEFLSGEDEAGEVYEASNGGNSHEHHISPVVKHMLRTPNTFITTPTVPLLAPDAPTSPRPHHARTLAASY